MKFSTTQTAERFLRLKDALLPEIEIVQMKYVTQGTFDTVLNAKKEYRPKLFRRLRTFTWIDPIHETVRLTPVTFDSDVEILHCPQSLHSKRDFPSSSKRLNTTGNFPKNPHHVCQRALKTGDKRILLMQNRSSSSFSTMTRQMMPERKLPAS